MMRTISALLFIGACIAACSPKKKEAAQIAPATDTLATYSGWYEAHYPNGTKQMQGELVKGKRQGVWLFYYATGTIQSRCDYHLGKREGRSVVYYPNGRSRYEGTYRQDTAVGAWSFYHEDGALMKTVQRGG